MSIVFSIAMMVFFALSGARGNSVDEAEEISQAIITFAKQTTNYHKMTNEFNAMYQAGQLKVNPINGAEIVKTFQSDLENTFNKKTAALRNIRDKVQEEKKNYRSVDEIQQMKYLNMREDDIPELLQVEESFSPTLPVNLRNSTVQIPTPIYANSTSTLNNVVWTQRIDPVFRQNYEQSNGSMLFQFYGDGSGLFRVYPGMKLGLTGENMTEDEQKEEEAKADFFDARRRGWFLLAASSPKDVVIIMDISGSMSGTKIGIARITAMSLIDTLTENDFFNVIAVKQDVKYMRPCTRHLIQATKYNKEKMKEALQHMGAVKNITNSTLAMSEAFVILNSGPTYNRTSGGCNQIIMFISDGVEEKEIAKDVFEKENGNKTVRVFTFLIGHIDHNLKKQSMMNTACNNRGYYYHIETLGNVWNTVLQYMRVVSRPMGLNKNNGNTIFSPIYEDAATKQMVMTLSMGVFDDKGVIGVAGTDISADSLLEKIPFHKMSSFSRVFVIDNNGFLVLHPNYERRSGFMHRNVFLEDFERGVDADITIQAKKQMIDRVTNGRSNFPTYVTSGEQNEKVVEVNGDVFFEPIKDTEFSSAVVIPKYGRFNVEYTGDDDGLLNRGIDALNSSSSSFNVTHSIAKWRYCSGRPGGKVGNPALPYYYNAKELLNLLRKYRKDKAAFPSQCNKALIKKLLLTASVVNKHVSESWTDPLLQSTDSLFVTTSGGYHKIKSSQSSFEPSHKVYAFEDVAGNPEDLVTVTVPSSDSKKQKNIVKLTSSVRVGNENVLAAVSGATITYDQFANLINNRIAPGNYLRLLIDRNGYVVFSTRDKGNEIGKFLGEVSYPLVQYLEGVGVLKKIQLQGLPTECTTEDTKCVNSSSNILLTPFKILSAGFFALVNAVSWVSLQYTLFLTTLTTPTHASSDDDKPKTYSCTMERTYYIIQEQKLNQLRGALGEDNLLFNCDSSSCRDIRFNMKRVPNTNLFVVSIRPTSVACQRECGKRRKLVEQEKMEDVSAPQRYRRVPGTCSNEVVDGEDTRAMCGRGSVALPSLWLLCILSMIYYNSC